MSWIMSRASYPIFLILLASTSLGCEAKDDGVETQAESTSTSGHGTTSEPTGSDATEQGSTATTIFDETTAGTESGTGADTSVGTSSTDDDSSSSSGGLDCTPHRLWPCGNIWGCFGGAQFTCGDVSSWVDENGCLRQPCGGREPECPEGMRCHHPAGECGRCLSTMYCENGATCSMENCGQDGDCGQSVCVPIDQFPEGYCD
jgi:hypothetical protein